VAIDLINILTKLGTSFSLNFLNLLESSTLDKGSLGFKVLRKNFSKLSAYIGEDVVRSKL